ncbi:MAG: T9SS type A sorting domain-containing protein [Candidatus Eisenbacteria bacterium]|nr:T9SS type A sorting domain-containing protein [Candidatus Eisenbacteria bacterium]
MPLEMHGRAVALACAILTVAIATGSSHADGTLDRNYADLLRRAKQSRIMSEPARHRRELEERAAAQLRSRARAAPRDETTKGAAQTPRPGARLRAPHAPEDPALAEPGASYRLRAARPLSGSTSFPPANVRINDSSGDIATAGQSEESLAADGQNALCAFNDGQGFVSATSTQGYGYSTDGGNTWVDGGSPPAPTGWIWSSDPIVTVDQKTHEFFFCALADSNASDPLNTWNGIALVKATFPGPGAPTWGTPLIVVRTSRSAYLYDKQWVVADSTLHALYLVYVLFDPNTNGIYFQRSTNQGATWTNAIQLSGAGEAGYVQGPRVAVGPGPTAPVYVTWYSIGPVDADYYRVRKSTTGGLSFGSTIIAVTAYHTFENGAPGFNRGNSVDFPSLAVDASSGAHRGRVYMAWHESVNYYGDTLYFSPYTGAGNRSEVEPNGTVAQANPFTLGQTLRGSLVEGDQDWFSFSGTQGQTVYFLVDSLDASIDNALRLICSDGVTRLAFSDPGAGVGYGGQIVFTLPANGTYYLRPAAPPGTGSVGGYRVRTALHHAVAGRSRDHRDVFVSHSDDAITWSTPLMVNDDSPWFDDWLPEVAVDGSGVIYVEWDDWRDAPAATCGGVSNTYLARSANGGAVFTSFGPITDVQTAWTSVASNIAPNQGDYLGLFANATAVYPAWADGRGGTPDVYTVPLPLPYLLVPTEISLVSADASPSRVSLAWYEAGDRSAATVYRRDSGEWAARATIEPDGEGFVRYDDDAVTPGATYHYRLGVISDGAEKFVGEVEVAVPLVPRFALERVWPNPAGRVLHVAFSLESNAGATLSLSDVAGRRVREREVGTLGAGRHVLDFSREGTLPSGLYLMRLTQGSRSLTARVAVVR